MEISKMISPKQDLKFEQLKIYYEEIAGVEFTESFANNLELLTEDGEYNYSAYLLADNNELSIKVKKYSGKNKFKVIENSEFGYCSIIKATHNILNKFELENITRTKITSTVRKEKRLVDQRALRAAIINAIVHNDYSTNNPPLFEIFSDKMVITSSGKLPIGFSKEKFFSGLYSSRNEQLIRAFKDIGLVQQLGSDVLMILDKYDKTMFKIDSNFIKVEFKLDFTKIE